MNSAFEEETVVNLKLMTIFARLGKSISNKVVPDIKKYGLTPNQFGVLEALYNKGPLTVNEIIVKTLSSSGNIDLVIKNLEKMNLVMKRVSAEDKRCRKVELTEKGWELISTVFPEHVLCVDNMFSRMGLSEKKELSKLMKNLSKSIGEL
ncbi:MAG: MarR family transcriptional regulator [Spirochaetales bacterium]|uniref:HTH-type transcriptional regulator SarZ n=1 Tax=Candidatus Thalassospirochaeta sargassi TaxID=3119039 RepID=A0AAJ1IDG2_9SPIO|nr:MarR family transcriptional regulator [Spirochaetales bacterium]